MHTINTGANFGLLLNETLLHSWFDRPCYVSQLFSCDTMPSVLSDIAQILSSAIKQY